MSPSSGREDFSQHIPVLDVGDYLAGKPGAASALATAIAEALEQIGFMLFVGHDVPQSLIDRTFTHAQRFHSQPLERKLELRMNEHNNGYMAQGQYAIVSSEHNETDEPERNEAFFVKRERAANNAQIKASRRLTGANLWPDDLPRIQRDRRRVFEHDGCLRHALLAGIVRITRYACRVFHRTIPTQPVFRTAFALSTRTAEGESVRHRAAQ